MWITVKIPGRGDDSDAGRRERGHASALTASGQCCRIAQLAGPRRTMWASAFPKSNWIRLLPKPPNIQSTVFAGKEASFSVTALEHRGRRKKGQSQSRPVLRELTGKYCAQRASKASRIRPRESARPKHG